jgi:hypothetical protein
MQVAKLVRTQPGHPSGRGRFRWHHCEDTTMKKTHITAILLGATLALGACADEHQPTAPAADAPALKRSDKAAERASLLTNVPVNGALMNGTAAAGSFVGTFTAKRFDIDPDTRQLSLTGVLDGTATLLDGTVVPVVGQVFTTTAALRGAGSAGAAGLVRPVSSAACESGAHGATTSLVAFRRVQLASCDVLFLDLGPLSLDLLGLTVDLAEVILDINAVTGPANLLGNLLCALLGLLDITALLTAITQLLTIINNILAGLNPGGTTGASFESPIAPIISPSQSA